MEGSPIRARHHWLEGWWARVQRTRADHGQKHSVLKPACYAASNLPAKFQPARHWQCLFLPPCCLRSIWCCFGLAPADQQGGHSRVARPARKPASSCGPMWALPSQGRYPLRDPSVRNPLCKCQGAPRCNFQGASDSSACPVWSMGASTRTEPADGAAFEVCGSLEATSSCAHDKVFKRESKAKSLEGTKTS